MDYKEFYEKMQAARLVSSNWRNILRLLDLECSGADKNTLLKIFILYFSLLDDGNVYMPLDKNTVFRMFSGKIEGNRIAADEDGAKRYDYEELLSEIRDIAENTSEIKKLSAVVDSDGKTRLFVVSEEKLYTRKNYNAIRSIEDSVRRLFTDHPRPSNSATFTAALAPGFSLSEGQKKIIETGIYNNLLITGGPGTGKTTSVFFLIFSLLKENPDCNIYLCAPAGKAASRMKDSILNSATKITGTGDQAITDKIKALEEYTIHRLLGYDAASNCFSFRKDKKFPENSVFVIDEASMIDVSIFAALLEAIPDKSRVFIMGDRNQLPSVECGAVFGGLLKKYVPKNNIVELDESQRFQTGSDVYNLAKAINAGEDLSYITDKWTDWSMFNTSYTSSSVTPVYFYRDEAESDSEMIDEITKKWYKGFYAEKKLCNICTDVVDPSESDADSRFGEIWKICENARILCACNRGLRGIQHINQVILREFYAASQSVSGFYPGEILIITKNNKSLDLYNGDCGVTVSFKGDSALYLMLRKTTKLSVGNKTKESRIFRIGDYLFYQIGLIGSDNISPAFAITIHKSQGSDYNNVLVILPRSRNHPLLNRQIIYTAITRAKNSTYILSNQVNLKTASQTVLTRNTF